MASNRTLLDVAVRRAAALGLLAMMGTGCREAETIRQYTVAKSQTVKLPSGWSKAPPDGISLAAFQVGDSSGAARVTVSRAGGSLALNINRWRGQLALPPLEDEQVDDSLQPFELAGAKAYLVEIAGGEESTFGVIVVDQSQSEFFKMRGDTKIVVREKANFEQFVRSYYASTHAGAEDGE